MNYTEDASDDEYRHAPSRITHTASSAIRKRKREDDEFAVSDGDEEPQPRKFSLSSYMKPVYRHQQQPFRTIDGDEEKEDLERSQSLSVSLDEESSSSSSEEADSQTQLKKLMQKCEVKTAALKEVLAKNNLQYGVCL